MCKVEKVDDFIGSTFPTPKGGVIKVTTFSGKRSGSSKLYTCECSICNSDEELFPEPFLVTRTYLTGSKSNEPRFPCGCGKRRWTKIQYKIRILRECESRGYTFLGFCEWEGVHTKLKLECGVDQFLWETTSIANFLLGVGCPECSRVKRSKPKETMVKLFFESGEFKEGTIFTRNLTRRTKQGSLAFWDMYCPTCSNDEFVQAGLCSGVFTAVHSSLQEGYIPCRCGRYSHTQEQQEFRIKRLCEEEGLTFLGWKDGYTGNHSKMLWICAEGHLCDTSEVKTFLEGGRCKTCRDLSSGVNGYYKERVGEVDYLYLMDFLVSDKVGRSFDVEDRRVSLKTVAGLKQKPEVLQVYTATHQVIYDTEQEIHAKLRKRGFQYTCSWTTECFTKDCWYSLQELLRDYVSSGVLTRVS